MFCSYYIHFNVFLGWIFQLTRLVPNEAGYMVSILVNELVRFSQRKIPLIRQKLGFQFVNVLCWFPSVRECVSIAQKTTQGDTFYWRKGRINIYNIIADLKRVRLKVNQTLVYASLTELQFGPLFIYDLLGILDWSGLIIYFFCAQCTHSPKEGNILWWVSVWKAIVSSGVCFPIATHSNFFLSRHCCKEFASPVVGFHSFYLSSLWI